MRIIFLLGLLLLINSVIRAQNLEFSGTIATNTSWDYDTVFLSGDVTIPADVILEISAGTKVISQAYYRIDVYGGINAMGNIDNMILFSVLDKTGFSDSTDYAAGAWDGLHFHNNAGNKTGTNMHYCQVEYCKALNAGNYKGGGIYVDNYNHLTINHCRIENNIAKSSGGGLFSNTGIDILNSEFNLNKAGQSGGALAFAGDVKPYVDHNIFYGNFTYQWEINPPPFLSYNTGVGSAVSIHSNQYNETGDIPVFTNNVFYANGQYTFYESSYRILIANNIFVNNMGSIFNGHSLSKGIIANNVFYGNCPLRLFVISEDYHMVNNIFWENHVLIIFHSVDYLIEPGGVFDGNNEYMHYCNFQEEMLQEHQGMISENPQFVNPPIPLDQVEISEMFFNPQVYGIEIFEMQEFDMSLSNSSPCINSGIPDTSLLDLPITDYLGNPRVFGGRIDMGAIENQHVISYIPSALTAKYSVFPNPCTNQIFIAGVKTGIPVEIFNVTGSSVLFAEYTPQGIDLSTLEPGFYTLRFTSNKNTQSIKFVKN